MNFEGYSDQIVEKVKYLYNNYWPNKRNSTKIVIFIVGCQRSGTTLLRHIFDKDIKTHVFSERSEISEIGKDGLRLKPYDVVEEIMMSKASPIKVLKPLVESQNVSKMINHFNNSKALWIYRDFKDVALSNTKKFGIKNGINDLKQIRNAIKNDWRSENISESSRSMIDRFFSDEMDPFDASAIFWLIRNSLFFEQHLETNGKVYLCKYEDLVNEPFEVMHRIYNWLGTTFPGNRCVRGVRSDSVGKGREINLSDDIMTYCEEMMLRLDRTYYS
jgi:hypothetical protein